MLTSTSPLLELRPMTTRLWRTMYSNSLPSSLAMGVPFLSGDHGTRWGEAGADFWRASRAQACWSGPLTGADIVGDSASRWRWRHGTTTHSPRRVRTDMQLAPTMPETAHARRPPAPRARVCKQQPSKSGFLVRCRPGAAAEGGPGGTSRARCCWLRGHRTGGFSEGMRLKWPDEIDRGKSARSLSLFRSHTHSLAHSLCRHMAHGAFRDRRPYMAGIS